MLKINYTYILSVVFFYFTAAALLTDIQAYRAYFGFGLFFIFAFVIFLNLMNVRSRVFFINRMSVGFGFVFWLFLLYMLLMVFSYIEDDRVPFYTNLRYLSFSVGGILATLIVLLCLKNNERDRDLIAFFAVALSLISLYKIYIFRNIILSDGSGVNVVTNWALIPVGFFPFVFYIKQKWARFGLLIVILVAAFLGNKRSGLIAILISILMIGFYLFLSRKYVIKFSHIVMFFLSISLFFLSYVFYSDLYFNSYLRIANINEDGGSGRKYIWFEIKQFLDSAYLEDLIFGGGANYYQVAVNPYMSSPHNDFLALILSYGIFGAMFYFFVLLRMLYFVFIHIKERSNLVLFSISLFFVFIVMSNVSGVFIYYTNYFSLFIGFAILESNHQKRVV